MCGLLLEYHPTTYPQEGECDHLRLAKYYHSAPTHLETEKLQMLMFLKSWFPDHYDFFITVTSYCSIHQSQLYSLVSPEKGKLCETRIISW